MHNAPSVSCLVGRCAWGLRFTLALWFGAILIATLWLGQSPMLGAAHAALMPLYGAAGWMAWREGRGSCSGQLSWNGRNWSWDCQGQERAGTAQLRFDGQSWLLVEFIGEDGRSVWLWPERGADPWRWHMLRQAIRAGSHRRHA